MTEHAAPGTSAQIEPATVTLTIPCTAEYVSVARLAILGIASRMPFSYDEVEDVRLAVGEACTHAVERAAAAEAESRRVAALTGSGAASKKSPAITITSMVSPKTLTIEVADNVAATSGEAGTLPDEFDDPDVDHQGLGALLIEILVDEVTIDTRADGTTIRLKKHAPAAT